MLRDVLSYGCVLVFLMLLDAGFLGLVAVPLFQATLGNIMLSSLRWTPAVLFYVVYAAGLLLFVIRPNAAAGWTTVAWHAAAFGFVAYATYDLTNYATLAPWTLRLVLTDLIWGSVASAIAATAAWYCGNALARLF